MKKIFALALALSMSLSLAACGGNNNGGNSAASNPGGAASSGPASPAREQEPATRHNGRTRNRRNQDPRVISSPFINRLNLPRAVYH